MKSFATILALAFVAVNAKENNGNRWGHGGNPTKGGKGGDNKGNAYGPDANGAPEGQVMPALGGNNYAYSQDKENKGNRWGPGGKPTKGGKGGDNNGNAYGPDANGAPEGQIMPALGGNANGLTKENKGNRWGPGGKPTKGGNGGDNKGNAYGPDANGAPEGQVMPALGGASLSSRAERRSQRTQGAMMVKASCKDMSDDSMMKVYAHAHSWEADGSGDKIASKRVQTKVDAMTVKISGAAKGPADSTCYAFIESDCMAEAPDSYDTMDADFAITTNMSGVGRFRFNTSEYVASDLIDGAMTLNLRDSMGDSMLCCVFEEVEEMNTN